MGRSGITRSMIAAVLATGLGTSVQGGSPDGGGSTRETSPSGDRRPAVSEGQCPAGMAYVPARALTRAYGPSAIVPAQHAFCMDILETTHADYAACAKAKACTPLQNEGRWGKRPRYPVLRATFEQAQAYCRFRAKRVPSANEWVRAGGGDEELWNPWGD